MRVRAPFIHTGSGASGGKWGRATGRTGGRGGDFDSARSHVYQPLRTKCRGAERVACIGALAAWQKGRIQTAGSRWQMEEEGIRCKCCACGTAKKHNACSSPMPTSWGWLLEVSVCSVGDEKLVDCEPRTTVFLHILKPRHW